jgi:REP element-mobilizing transposase RayT
MILNDMGDVVLDVWQWLAKQYNYVSLDANVIMPNHFHGVIAIKWRRGDSRIAPTHKNIGVVKRKPLGRLIGAFKTVSTKRINEIRKTPGAIVWQRNYYEHIIRNNASLDRIRKYIISNPSRWNTDRNNFDPRAIMAEIENMPYNDI